MAPTAIQIIPTLSVTSIPLAVKHYTQVLGFHLCECIDDSYAWVALPAPCADQSPSNIPLNLYLRQRGSLNWSERDMNVSIIDIRLGHGEGDLEVLFAALRKRGVVPVTPITHGPFRVKHFRISDQDGNMINFSQALPDLNFKAPVGVNGKKA